MPYDALGNYTQGDEEQPVPVQDVWETAKDYLRTQRSGPRHNPQQDTVSDTPQWVAPNVPVSNAPDPALTTPEAVEPNKMLDRKFSVAVETIPRLPTMAAGMLDFIPRMVDAAKQPDTVIGNDGKPRPVSPIEAFGQAEFGQKSSDQVAAAVTERLKDAIRNDPALAQDKDGLDALRDKYVEDEKVWYRKGLTEFNDNISDTVGAPRDADKTLGEKVESAVVSALVPIPGVSAAAGAGKASKVAEIATDIINPGTNLAHYTPLGVGINAGAGAAGEVVVDYLAHRNDPEPVEVEPGKMVLPNVDPVSGTPMVASTMVDTDKSHAEHAADAHAESPFITQAGALAVLAPLAVLFGRKGAAGAAPNAVPDALRALQSKQPTPTVSTALPKTGWFARQADELAGTERGLKNAGLKPEDAIDVTNQASKFIGGNVHRDIDHHYATGELPGSTIKLDTTLRQHEQFMKELRDISPKFEQDFHNGLIAKTELRTRSRYAMKLNNDIQLYDRMEQSALQRKDNRLAKTYRTQKNKAMQEMLDFTAGRTAPGVKHWSTQELLAAEAKFDKMPMFKQHQAKIVSDNKKWLQYSHEQGNISTKSFKTMMDEVDTYLPRMKDPYEGATGAGRLWAKSKHWIGSKVEDPHGDGSMRYTDATSPFATRGFDNGEAAVGHTMHWLDALRTRAEHSIRYAQRQNFRRTVVDNLRSRGGTTVSDVMETIRHGKQGRTVMSREKWHKVFEADKSAGAKSRGLQTMLDEGKIIPITRGDNLEFVRFHDPVIHGSFSLPPTVSNAFTNLVQMGNKPFRALTTGDLSNFHGVSALFDTSTIGTTRGIGTVYGVDALALKGAVLANKFGANISPDMPALQGAIHAGRVVDNALAHTPAYLLNLGTALASFSKTYGNHVATALAGDLTARSPVFAAIGKVAPQYVHQIARNVMRAYSDSLFAIAADNHVVVNAQYRRMHKDIKEMDKLLTAHVPEGVRHVGNMAWAPFQEAWEAYKHAISALEGAGRMAYQMRQVEMEAMKHGGDWRRIPKAKLDKIMRDSRTLAGDYARRPGSPMLQMATQVFPYYNPMLKTTRALASRLFDTNDKKTAAYLGTMALSGAVLPRIQSDLWMTSTNDNLRDWYYNRMPDWEREQLIIYPKPKTMWTLLSRNQAAIQKLTKDDFYPWMLPPEFRPYASAASAAMRSLHAYNDHGRVAEDHPLQAFGIGLGQAVSPMFPPLLNGLMQLSGGKIDIQKYFSGQSPIQQGAAGTRSGAYDQMNLTSSIPNWMGEVIATVFGAGGSRLTQAFDTGHQVYEQNGHHYLDAIVAGAQEFKQRHTEGYGRVGVPLVSDVDTWTKTNIGVGIPFVGAAADKAYKRTQASETVKAIRDITGMVSGRGSMIKAESLYDLKDGSGVVLGDIVKDIQAATRDPEYDELSKEWRETNDAIARIEADRALPYDQRNAQRISLTRDLQTTTNKQAALLHQIEEDLRTDWGVQYKTWFKVPFSFQDFARRVAVAKRQTMIEGVE